MSVPRQGALHDIRNIIATLRLLSESLEENRDKSVALKAERMTRCIDRCVSACNAEVSGPGRATVGAAFCLRDLLRDLRHEETQKKLSSPRWRLGLKIHSWLASRPGLYHFLTGTGIGLLHRVGRKKGAFRKLPMAGGWTSQRDFPAPQGPTFMQQYKSQLRSQSSTTAKRGQGHGR